MHLDMNALEHTYLAVFVRADDRLGIEHLVAGMAALDPRTDAGVLPRFVGVPARRRATGRRGTTIAAGTGRPRPATTKPGPRAARCRAATWPRS
jgi:hypothetical protein